ncbi:LptF/LptG family permease, partial [Candidatus Sumerlaeota bacterium]|nr:LptF/LptG family permease [Candidatus Sumerlaeota bacterium]
MRLLDRYIAREYLIALLAVTFILTVLMLVSIILEHIDDVIESSTPVTVALKWFTLLLPFKMVQTIPVIVLLGVMFSIGNLSRHNEIIAIVSTGISRGRIFMPVLGVTVILTLFTLIFSEVVVPNASRAAELTDRVQIQGKPPPTEARETFLRGAGDTYYWMDAYLDYANRPRMVRPSVLRLSGDRSHIAERIDAETAIHIRPNRPGAQPHWRFLGGTLWQFDESGALTHVENFRERNFQLEDDLTEFLSVREDPEGMDFLELWRYIDVLSTRPGVDLDEIQTELHLKLAFPLSLIIIAMMAFPFAMKTRSGSLFVGFSLAILWLIAYYGFVAVMRSLGHEGHLWPWFAAWAPDVVFLVVASYFMGLW